MQRTKCIFCLTTDSALFNTKEHIIPESLGSDDWAILPEGLFCDKCQNLFGSSIEQQAISAYPFSNFRTFFGIPTKKGKAPWFSHFSVAVGVAFTNSFTYPFKHFTPKHFRDAGKNAKKA